jgi:hypothetical protein
VRNYKNKFCQSLPTKFWNTVKVRILQTQAGGYEVERKGLYYFTGPNGCRQSTNSEFQTPSQCGFPWNKGWLLVRNRALVLVGAEKGVKVKKKRTVSGRCFALKRESFFGRRALFLQKSGGGGLADAKKHALGNPFFS